MEEVTLPASEVKALRRVSRRESAWFPFFTRIIPLTGI